MSSDGLDSERMLRRFPWCFEITLTHDYEKEVFVAVSVFDPALKATGKTWASALSRLKMLVANHIQQDYLDHGKTPSKYSEEDFSGRFSFRPGVELHARLTREAELHGMTLNEYCKRRLS